MYREDTATNSSCQISFCVLSVTWSPAYKSYSANWHKGITLETQHSPLNSHWHRGYCLPTSLRSLYLNLFILRSFLCQSLVSVRVKKKGPTSRSVLRRKPWLHFMWSQEFRTLDLRCSPFIYLVRKLKLCVLVAISGPCTPHLWTLISIPPSPLLT